MPRHPEKSWTLEQWPLADQHAWTIARVKGDVLEPGGEASHFRLRAILGEADKIRRERLAAKAKKKVVRIDPATLVVNSRGRPWTESGFRASFFKFIGQLVTDGKVKPRLTFHGLRHTQGKLIVEAGGSTRDVSMLIGDRSEAMGKLYSEEHEKRQRVGAMVRRLERNEGKKMENSLAKIGKPKKARPLSP